MIKRLQIQNLRVLEQIDISPSAGINLIVGSNGAGKTSLLEAIYVLVHGRSFRYRDVLPLINENEEAFKIVARFTANSDFEHTLGMSRSKKELLVRLDGRLSVKRSEILDLMPVIWIGSNPQDLMTSAPEIRRSFLDSGLFHVKPEYLKALQDYQRALDQRNATLKSSGASLAMVRTWDNSLVESAKKIDAWRLDYMQAISEQVHELMHGWYSNIELDIVYQKGWSAELSLSEALERAIETDMRLKYTTTGIHRADIQIKSHNLKTGRVLSRGQLKMLACAFYFAQSKLIKKSKRYSTTLLFDDLSAELDYQNRAYLIAALDELFDQSFVTVLNKEDIDHTNRPMNMFHVEQGRID